MQPIQIVITFDPNTNGLKVEAPLQPSDLVLILERAKLTVVQHASQPKSPIAVATAGLEQALLSHGQPPRR